MQANFRTLKENFENEPFTSFDQRIKRLDAIQNLFQEFTDDLCQAISEDFGFRSFHETKLAEIFPILSQIKYTKKNLSQWMKEDSRTVELFFQFSSAKVIRVPLGVVGILVPWNFPLLLAFSPLITAIAGGNHVMLKMSELTPKTAHILKIAIEKYLNDCVRIFAGDLESNKEFSEISFDHIFFTGSPRVGSLVMQAAAKNLTPVTLELGGKCPVFTAPDTDFQLVAEKVIWGKSLNAGQVCLAPDYLLCPEDKLSHLINEMKHVFSKLYPFNDKNEHYTSIINRYHFDRIVEWLEEAQLGGAEIIALTDHAIKSSERIIFPHLIINPSPTSRVMNEEIFGPLLPIITYRDFNETKSYLQKNPNPLAIYLFTKNKKIIKDFQNNTSSGGLCINNTIIHIAQEDLPFGGVRSSGLGQYHGFEGYLTFTRPKAVFKSMKISLLTLVFPPYHKIILKLFYWLIGLKN